MTKAQIYAKHVSCPLYAGIERFSSTTKPSAAECNLNTYTWFVIAEPKYGECCRKSIVI
ncbi:MAG: hypothetical protein V7K40_15075 [Nostoc sp.]|uniref:hypothetical protein n=1 Tax=Nostoc sp. TaxID=1180 RepID=UPI002FF9D363